MKPDDYPAKAWKWLQKNPSLGELRAEYPEEWAAVERDLATIFRHGTDQLQAYIKQTARQEALLTAAFTKGQKTRKTREAILAQLIRNRMLQLVIKEYCFSVATGIKEGKARFNLLNGLLVQKLLFSRGLERKPVSLFWFRLLWPLLWQKRLLMPLVQPEGIYCFYSQALIAALAGMIGSRSCLEIAAGDGTLTRFLKDRGIQATATDDYSWGHAARYPEWVIKREAREALRLYAPEVVICSWPPADNNFERQIFKTRSVQLYIVIGSRHRHAAGNWNDYTQQTAFSFTEELKLSILVLPPELDSAVYVFRRN
ncbi:MAG: hypothetical protein A2521_01750 [Deltaproteobacteria bacterium RIFOXYD12_FULL_57_12]|nr:MAG: hypothetical protein A2521_01750 [Deltaproteobacteria bacterium RIFOXYD12_FULL_57_12]